MLAAELRSILKLDRSINVGLVGVGHLGEAFAHYLIEQGSNLSSTMRLVALYDSDKAKVGKDVAGITVCHVSHLVEHLKEQSIRLLLITVPADAAQDVAEKAAEADVEAILNFSPVKLTLPDRIRVHYADLGLELEHLAYYINN
jgi:redox-sensing transcriptional repressor